MIDTFTNEINILYQSSDAYAPVMGVSITSLLENNKHIPLIRIFIIDSGISDTNKQRINELTYHYNCEIHFLNGKSIDNILEEKKVNKWRDSYAVFYKIYALDLIEIPVSRLLAVDADTIINKKIDTLYNYNLNGHTLGMIQDFMPQSYMNKIGMSNKDTYYNSGIVLFDVKQWKEKRYNSLIETFLQNNFDKILYADQDAISIVLQNDIQKIPLEYNFYIVFSAMQDCLSFDVKTLYKLYDLDDLNDFYSVDEILRARKDACVYHFEGGTVVGRPWEEGEQYSAFDIWLNYKEKSLWSDMPKMKSRSSSFHAKEKKLRKILPLPLFTIVYKIAYNIYWNRILKIRPNN